LDASSSVARKAVAVVRPLPATLPLAAVRRAVDGQPPREVDPERPQARHDLRCRPLASEIDHDFFAADLRPARVVVRRDRRRAQPLERRGDDGETEQMFSFHQRIVAFSSGSPASCATRRERVVASGQVSATATAPYAIAATIQGAARGRRPADILQPV